MTIRTSSRPPTGISTGAPRRYRAGGRLPRRRSPTWRRWSPPAARRATSTGTCSASSPSVRALGAIAAFSAIPASMRRMSAIRSGRLCRAYRRRFSMHGGPMADIPEVVARTLGSVQGGRVLEAGCGDGEFTEMLVEQFASYERIDAVDADEDALEQARA